MMLGLLLDVVGVVHRAVAGPDVEPVRGREHLLLEPLYDVIGVAVEEGQQLVDEHLVRVGFDLAGCRTEGVPGCGRGVRAHQPARRRARTPPARRAFLT